MEDCSYIFFKKKISFFNLDKWECGTLFFYEQELNPFDKINNSEKQNKNKQIAHLNDSESKWVHKVKSEKNDFN